MFGMYLLGIFVLIAMPTACGGIKCPQGRVGQDAQAKECGADADACATMTCKESGITAKFCTAKAVHSALCKSISQDPKLWGQCASYECSMCTGDLCNHDSPLECYEDKPGLGGMKEKKCPAGTKKCLTLTDCIIPGLEGLHSPKACLHPDPGGDPCRIKVPVWGKTYKEMCRECATCNTNLCNDGKADTDKALQCYKGQDPTGEVTNCPVGTKGCVVALDCGPGGFVDYRDCSLSEDPCNMKLSTEWGGDTPNAVCNSCKFCRDSLCNKNGSAGIFGLPQVGLAILALLLGFGLKMLMMPV